MRLETSEEVGHPPAAPMAAVKPLEYDKSSGGGISRRQMNVFLLLLAVNTFLFAAFVCLPAAFPTLKQEWGNFMKARAERKQAAKDDADRQAKLEACLQYSAPADAVLYTEDAAEGEKVLAASSRGVRLSATPSFRGNGLTVNLANAIAASGWRPAVLVSRPRELVEWRTRAPTRTGYNHEPAVLFLHEMRNPSGARRLVLVEMSVRNWLQDVNPDTPDEGKEFEIETQRSFHGTVIDPRKAEAEVRTTLVVADARPGRARLSIERPGDATKPVARLLPASPWRVYAGQADAADPGHMTIDYEVAGVRGTIDGYLNDGDRLMLEPRAGRREVWESSSQYRWDLTAVPATAPTR